MADFRPILNGQGISDDNKDTIDMFLNILYNCQTNKDLLLFLSNIEMTKPSIFQTFLKAGAFKHLCNRYRKAILANEAHEYLSLFLRLPLTQEIIKNTDFLELIRETLKSSKEKNVKLAQRILLRWGGFEKKSPTLISPAPSGVARAKSTKISRQDRLCEAIVEKAGPSKSVKVPQVSTKKLIRRTSVSQIGNLEHDFEISLSEHTEKGKKNPEFSSEESLKLIKAVNPKELRKSILRKRTSGGGTSEDNLSESPTKKPSISYVSSPGTSKVVSFDSDFDKRKNVYSLSSKSPTSSGSKAPLKVSPEKNLTESTFDETDSDEIHDLVIDEDYTGPLNPPLLDLSDAVHFQHKIGSKSTEKLRKNVNPPVVYSSTSKIPNSPAEPDKYPATPRMKKKKFVQISSEKDDEDAFKRASMKR